MRTKLETQKWAERIEACGEYVYESHQLYYWRLVYTNFRYFRTVQCEHFYSKKDISIFLSIPIRLFYYFEIIARAEKILCQISGQKDTLLYEFIFLTSNLKILRILYYEPSILNILPALAPSKFAFNYEINGLFG